MHKVEEYNKNENGPDEFVITICLHLSQKWQYHLYKDRENQRCKTQNPFLYTRCQSNETRVTCLMFIAFLCRFHFYSNCLRYCIHSTSSRRLMRCFNTSENILVENDSDLLVSFNANHTYSSSCDIALNLAARQAISNYTKEKYINKKRKKSKYSFSYIHIFAYSLSYIVL